MTTDAPAPEAIFVGDSQFALNTVQPRTLGCLTGNCSNLNAPYRSATFAIAGYSLGAGFGCMCDFDAPVAAKYDQNTVKHVVLWGGTNDLGAGNSAAVTYTRLQDRVNAYRAAGYTRIVVLTALPRTSGADVAGYEARRITFNDSVRTGAGSGTWTVADVAGITQIGDAGDENDTTYYETDKIHIKVAAAALIAPVVTTAIQSLP